MTKQDEVGAILSISYDHGPEMIIAYGKAMVRVDGGRGTLVAFKDGACLDLMFVGDKPVSVEYDIYPPKRKRQLPPASRGPSTYSIRSRRR